jgi:ribosomal protein S18 acetylase RimI-like enzyme
MGPMVVRPATPDDAGPVWQIVEPILRAGETYALPSTWSRDDALAYWFSPGHEVFVAEESGRILGTYFLQSNQLGGGAHVANCGYMTAPDATGRGVARAMCLHSLEQARAKNFSAMQFNFVVSTNERAVRLWSSLGFEVVGRLPGAFNHPSLGLVDALLMFRQL